MAEAFAKVGYDFVTMDPRGFGYSEGRKGYIESVEHLIEDQLAFN
jgi:alpha-beta hydrolase superfamily lysophospholipase